MAKILTARQAVDTYFYDGATVTFGGFANGLMHPEEIMVALEEAARSSGHPRGLRVVYASGQGDSGERGLNHLAVDGMCTTVIGGHWGLAPKLGGLAAENKLAAYNLPQGVISGLFREIAAKRPGVITHVGLDTFVDPRLEGGKMNRAAHEAGDMVKLIELEGEEKLFYPAFPIDIAVIRATYADERGNCTFEREGVYAEALAQAQAAHNSGGRVIVQVEKVVSYGCLDARLIRLPGIYVDALVVARPENHMQTFGTRYNPAFSGEVRVPLHSLPPLPMGERKIIARRAAMELLPHAVTNLGIGMPEGRDVFINACHYMIEGLQVVKESNGKTLADLKYIAPHQANKRIMATIARQIDFPEDRILSNIGEVGNTGCPSCGIALSQNLDRVERGDLVGLTVFGGGYSCGAVLLEFI